MMNLSGKKSHSAVDPMGGALRDKPDTAGGMAYTGSEGGSVVKPAKGATPKSAMMDGPYGGKVKA